MTKKTWVTPALEVFGSMAEITQMPVPAGCATPGNPALPPPQGGPCSGHKGFLNPETPDTTGTELSHPPDGTGGVS